MTMYSYIWVLEALMLASDSHTVTSDEKASNINTPASKEVLSFYQDLINDGAVRCVAGADGAKVSADAMNQNCAMWYWSTANLTQNLEIAKENGFELDVCFFPENKTRGVPTGGCNLIMSSQQSEAEKEASWQFIQWMTEPEQAAYAHLYTGYVPSRKAAAAMPEVQEMYNEYPQFKVALEQLELYGHGRPMNPGYAQASAELVSIMDAIWVNGADIDSTVAAAEPKLNQMLN
jgi:sn-glycerol 3-phosphate transport system substrate-binding protein